MSETSFILVHSFIFMILTVLPLWWFFRQATNLITKKELLTMDPDTDDSQLVYEITAEPKHGFLESKQKPGSGVTTFTQGTEPGLLLAPQPPLGGRGMFSAGLLTITNAEKHLRRADGRQSVLSQRLNTSEGRLIISQSQALSSLFCRVCTFANCLLLVSPLEGENELKNCEPITTFAFILKPFISPEL